MYKKILLATDGSEHSIRGAKSVIEICENKDCHVVIFHSIKHISDKISSVESSLNNTHFVNNTIAGMPYFTYSENIVDLSSYENIHEYKEDLVKIGSDILNYKNAMFETAHIPVETRLIEDEDPEDYILRIIKEENFDLVVIGSKGIHSKLEEIFIGSIAQKVINHSTCDVLVIK